MESTVLPFSSHTSFFLNSLAIFLRALEIVLGLTLSFLATTSIRTSLLTSVSKVAAHSEPIVKYLEEKIPLYQFLRWCRGIAYLT